MAKLEIDLSKNMELTAKGLTLCAGVVLPEIFRYMDVKITDLLDKIDKIDKNPIDFDKVPTKEIMIMFGTSKKTPVKKQPIKADIYYGFEATKKFGGKSVRKFQLHFNATAPYVINKEREIPIDISLEFNTAKVDDFMDALAEEIITEIKQQDEQEREKRKKEWELEQQKEKLEAQFYARIMDAYDKKKAEVSERLKKEGANKSKRIKEFYALHKVAYPLINNFKYEEDEKKKNDIINELCSIKSDGNGGFTYTPLRL